MYNLKIKMLHVWRYIYIGNTQETFKKRMDGQFSDLLRLIRNEKKPDLFSAHSKQPFNANTSHKDLRKYVTFKVVLHLNPVGTMKTFTKSQTFNNP